MNTTEFFQQLWADYTTLTPQAASIHELFCDDNYTPRNDHVAFRTFNISPINLLALEVHLLRMGYRRYEAYQFEEKKLEAWSYSHVSGQAPRVFLSQLQVEKLSKPAQDIIQGLVKQVEPAQVGEPQVFWSGRLWSPPSWETYNQLLAESEYAAWLSIFGLRANHFTISINHLPEEPDIQTVVNRLIQAGYNLNTAGGVIKGTPADLLQQASTLAEIRPVTFAGGDTHPIPSCYYEFALRHPDASGQLYDGFVAASADRIFESTHQHPKAA